MVTCKCCQEIYDNSKGMCPRCGLPGRFGEGITEKEINTCRNNYLGNLEVYFAEYRYEISENDISSEVESNLKLLARPIEMECGEIVWFPEKFEDIPNIQQITVDISIKRASQLLEPLPVTIHSENKRNFLKIGIMMTPGFRFRIVAGDENSYVESGEYSFT